MAKRKSLIVSLISTIVGLVMLVAIIAVALIAFVKIKFDVNLFDVISQVKTLTEEVNENEAYTNKFLSDDLQSTQVSVNTSFNADVVTYSEAEGYKISDSISNNLSVSLQLSDKQVAALISMILKNQENPTGVTIGDTTLTISLVQVQFSNLVDNAVDYNVVVKVDLTPLKENMSGFPFNLISNYLPNNVYISSTITITKGANAFEYSYTSKSLEINNLKNDEVNSLLTTINKFIEFGDVAKLNNMIAGSFADAMLGNSEVNGFAYSLKNAGATDFNFVESGEQILLEITI